MSSANWKATQYDILPSRVRNGDMLEDPKKCIALHILMKNDERCTGIVPAAFADRILDIRLFVQFSTKKMIWQGFIVKAIRYDLAGVLKLWRSPCRKDLPISNTSRNSYCSNK